MSAGPPVPALYLGTLVLFLVAVRSRWPWTRLGGGVVLAASFAALAPVLASPAGRRALLAPERLPATVFLAAAAVVVWWSLHRERQRSAPADADEPAEARVAGVRRWWLVAAGLACVLAAAALVPAPVPTPGDGRVPWFLAGLDLLARLVEPWVARVLVPATALVALVLAPWLDTREPETEAPFGGRRDEVPFFVFAWLFLGAVPLALGVFAPAGAPAAEPLSERFWIDLLGQPPPPAWGVRELPGLVLVVLLFVVLPAWLPRWSVTRGVFGRHLKRLGPWRYAAVMAIAGVVVLVPAQVATRWLFGVGPWIHLPGAGWAL